MQLVNAEVKPSEVRAGDIIIIVGEARNPTRTYADAATVESVAFDSPGWIIEYRIAFDNDDADRRPIQTWGEKYFHATDKVGVIRMVSNA
jgi:hypothetical protein